MIEWIKAEDELPKPSEEKEIWELLFSNPEILMCNGDNEVQCGWYHVDEGFIYNDDARPLNWDAIHWAPINLPQES